MKVQILKEAGHEEALLGMSLSFYDHKNELSSWWEGQRGKAKKRARKLATIQGGHNKFIESINVYIYIQASRDFWAEFDTYRVGMTKLSSSTMHTLSKRYVNKDDFEVGTSRIAIGLFNFKLWQFKRNIIDLTDLKKNLPEGWLQERVVTTNYKALQNIIQQRKKHKLKQWGHFCREVYTNLERPEYIGKIYDA